MRDTKACDLHRTWNYPRIPVILFGLNRRHIPVVWGQAFVSLNFRLCVVLRWQDATKNGRGKCPAETCACGINSLCPPDPPPHRWYITAIPENREMKEMKFSFFFHQRHALSTSFGNFVVTSEWLTFCQNWWTCYYFLWKKLNFHFLNSPIFGCCPVYITTANWWEGQCVPLPGKHGAQTSNKVAECIYI